MISNEMYISRSLETNLFFQRIMKEHAIFIGSGITFRDPNLLFEAVYWQNVFAELLSRTVSLADGLISEGVARSGELVTNLTYPAERQTEFLTGIPIDSTITLRELALTGMREVAEPTWLLAQISFMNRQTILVVNQFIAFKMRIHQEVLACRLFTHNYPHFYAHVIDEARMFVRMLEQLERREDSMMGVREMIEQEDFWNHIMGDHAEFIRGLLDPTEEALIELADKFAEEYKKLQKEIEALAERVGLLPALTRRTLETTTRFSNFKRQGTEGILACRIRGIALPLLMDHVLREANHYLRLLRMFALEREE